MRVISNKIFCGLFILSLCACGDENSSRPSNDESSSELSNEERLTSSSDEQVASSSSFNWEEFLSSESSSSFSIFDLLSSSSLKAKSSSSQAADNPYQNLDEYGYAPGEREGRSSSSVPVGTDDEVRASYFNNNLSYGEMTDKRDGQVYKTIVIGDQTWMAENLNYDGFDDYPYSYTKNEFVDKPDSNKKYGIGYQFYRAKEACPEDWHLPSTPEWQTMVDYVASHTETPVAKALKSTVGWPPTRTGTNEFGFNAVFDINDFKNYGIIQAFYWSSSVPNSVSSTRYVFALDFDSDSMQEQGVYEGKLQPIRCIKDSENTATGKQEKE